MWVKGPSFLGLTPGSPGTAGRTTAQRVGQGTIDRGPSQCGPAGATGTDRSQTEAGTETGGAEMEIDLGGHSRPKPLSTKKLGGAFSGSDD